MTTPTDATLTRAVLGRGLALVPVPGGEPALDLAWSAGPSLVEGADNLAQDLAVALLTPLGSDPFATGFVRATVRTGLGGDVPLTLGEVDLG